MYLKRLHKTNPFANGARACAYASTHAGAEIFVQLVHMVFLIDLVPTYLLLPLGKWGSKSGDFHWAMVCV